MLPAGDGSLFLRQEQVLQPAGWVHCYLWPLFSYLQLCIQMLSFSHRTWLGGRVVEGALHRIWLKRKLRERKWRGYWLEREQMSAEKASKPTEKSWRRSTLFCWSVVACLKVLCDPQVIGNCGQPCLQAWVRERGGCWWSRGNGCDFQG